MTESGKSTLAKLMIQRYKNQQRLCAVLDPLHYNDWYADYQTSDPEAFLEVVWASENLALFVDEAGDAIGKYSDVMNQLATRGRHWGHNCCFMVQRMQQISTTVRDQCRYAFIFRVSVDDAKILANEFGVPELKQANTLEQGEYFQVQRFPVPGQPRFIRSRVFTPVS